MISNEIIKKTTDLRKEVENALMVKNGEVTRVSNQGFSLIIGTGIEDQEEMDFDLEEYPEYPNKKSNEYDSWLG